MAKNKFTCNSTFGERLRDSMVIAGVSSAGLAKMRGVSMQTVRDWLRMPIARLSGEHMACIGMELGCSVRWLALGVGTPVPIGLKHAREEAKQIYGERDD
jgi:hypothetical protein